MSSSPPPPPLPRSRLLTAFAWVIIVVSALGIPISVISGFMMLAGSYGTQNADPLGAFTVLFGPTLTLVSGVGVLLRQPWARWAMIFVLSAIIVSNVWTMISVELGPSEYISPSGVPTTVLKSGGLYLSPIVGFSAMAIVFLFTRRVRAECQGNALPQLVVQGLPPAVRDSVRGWRVFHTGRDGMYYEEKHDGAWRQIPISGEMLMGRAHHVIYFRSRERWQEYPEWARGRRDEIIARIKSEFRKPDYEYSEDASTDAIAAAVAEARRILPPPLPAATTHAPSAPRTTQGLGALVASVAIFIAIAVLMGWLVRSGLEKGETWWPTKRASQSRLVQRANEPEMYWISIALYAAIGLGSGGFAAWLVKEGIHLRRR